MKFKLAFLLVLACLSVARAQEHGQDDCTICPGNTGKLKRSDAPIPPRTKGCANAAFLGFGSLHTDQRFDPCCNRLTQCYLECNVTKTYCDADFFKCMLNVCGINTAVNANNTGSGDIPDTDGTGSFANFTGTSGNLSCRDKAVCHAGYVKGNEWCDKYDDLQHDYCYCRAGYDVPISQPADAIPLPGYTGGNAYCFSDGVTRMASTAALPQSTGAQSFGKAVVLCLVLFIGMAFATHFSTRKEKQ